MFDGIPIDIGNFECSNYFRSSLRCKLWIHQGHSEGRCKKLLNYMKHQINIESARIVPRLEELRCRLGYSQRRFQRELARAVRNIPWFIVDSKEGGLHEFAIENSFVSNLVGCSAAPHHGVITFTEGTSQYAALATGREQGGEWDPARDFGHEYAHARFAQIPLFSQSLEQIAQGLLGQFNEIDDESVQLATVVYISAELLVWFARREDCMTGSGVPRIYSHKQLLWLMDKLSKWSSFHLTKAELAALAHEKVHSDSSLALELAAAAWPVVQVGTHFIDSTEPPCVNEWKKMSSEYGYNLSRNDTMMALV